MRSPVTRITIVVTALIAATVGLLILAMLQQTKVSCEVCISFRGRTQCRNALGSTRDEAIRTATDNACAYLASGMADSIECSSTPPLEVVCDVD